MLNQKGGPGAVVESLHLCPGGLAFESASLRNKQGEGCLEISLPPPQYVGAFSTAYTLYMMLLDKPAFLPLMMLIRTQKYSLIWKQKLVCGHFFELLSSSMYILLKLGWKKFSQSSMICDVAIDFLNACLVNWVGTGT